MKTTLPEGAWSVGALERYCWRRGSWLLLWISFPRTHLVLRDAFRPAGNYRGFATIRGGARTLAPLVFPRQPGVKCFGLRHLRSQHHEAAFGRVIHEVCGERGVVRCWPCFGGWFGAVRVYSVNVGPIRS